MNKLSLIGSCQQVVMINLSAIKSHVKKTSESFRIQKHLLKNHLTVLFTFVLYSKIRAVVFSKQFWVVDAPFERSSPLRLPVFTMEDSENTEDHRALQPLQSEKLL